MSVSVVRLEDGRLLAWGCELLPRSRAHPSTWVVLEHQVHDDESAVRTALWILHGDELHGCERGVAAVPRTTPWGQGPWDARATLVPFGRLIRAPRSRDAELGT